MKSEYRKEFSNGSLDFENKRYYSNDKQLYLQWKTRNDSDKPENPQNQQTSVGVVELRNIRK